MLRHFLSSVYDRDYVLSGFDLTPGLSLVPATQVQAARSR